jgi:hypothetical protein
MCQSGSSYACPATGTWLFLAQADVDHGLVLLLTDFYFVSPRFAHGLALWRRSRQRRRDCSLMISHN